ncbi:unnamed protein product [Parascedosporium putredinis]|uniref:Aconitase/3-isopropylmalate dehydratase large subunit alpha/beta/alpha domain-containing protein n=1 Tax=Parascedosporium putredinis TaxID=1442378 RepID=A0A9P1H0F2_9PEZI|nr:unnamed protein product [Parascedosporium putredinis]CAI7993899.1 unnamed protein product [Parascedosporium putredinis]
MALVTGEIWFKVPECVNIRFEGKPARGIGGKDVILYVLQQLKRNTVAADRVVEYTGPGLQYLSPDARFAIANMTTEFGGITGVFVPDAITQDFIQSRKLPKHKKDSHYFRPDEDAEYAETCVIDLAKAQSFIAKYPNPDDVVPVSEMTNTVLDGCFIGACTTAEEDLVLGALVLEQGLKNGMRPVQKGKRKVVPGSRPILDMLQKTGLTAVYEEAGFEIGLPGCSYCVGSIGNLASAATVAASSFSMSITDPQPLIDMIDSGRWDAIKGRGSLKPWTSSEPLYVDPPECATEGLGTGDGKGVDAESVSLEHPDQATGPTPGVPERTGDCIKGKIQRLGDFVDTDAVSLLGITITNQRFFDLALDGYDLSVDLVKNVVVVGGQEFSFSLSKMEKELIGLGGITPGFMRFGKQLFQGLCSSSRSLAAGPKEGGAGCSTGKALEW